MIRINNEVWNIKFVNPNDLILRNSDGTYTCGVTIPEWNMIFLANNLHGDMLRHVIAHELTHAQLASRGLIVPEYEEECIADWVADNTLDIAHATDKVCNYYNRC